MSVDLVSGLQWYLVFLYSTTLHEAAHAWAALKLGDDTAYQGGQVTLDPTPHIRREPIGMVVVPLLSFLFGGWMIGWASTPYDPAWAMRYPRRSAWMSLAGPAANLLMVVVAGLAIRVGMLAGVFEAPSRISSMHITLAADGSLMEFLAIMLSIVFSLNLLLCIFNLLPLPPMDGSSAVRLVLPESAAEKYFAVARQPGFGLLGLMMAWQLFGVIYPPIQTAAVNLLYHGAGYH